MTPAPGTRLGSYEVLGPIGAGGGEVYRARGTRLGGEVAINPGWLAAASCQQMLGHADLKQTNTRTRRGMAWWTAQIG